MCSKRVERLVERGSTKPIYFHSNVSTCSLGGNVCMDVAANSMINSFLFRTTN